MEDKHIVREKKSEFSFWIVVYDMKNLCLKVSFRFRNAYFPSTVHLIAIVENDEWTLLKLVLC